MAVPADGLEALLEATGHGILVVGQDGRIERASARVAALFGYGADELPGLAVDQLVPPALRERHAAHRAAYATAPWSGRMGEALRCHGRRKDGTEFPVEVDLGFTRTGTGTGVLAVVRDVTAHRRAERRLQAEFAVTRVMAEAATLAEATPRLLGALGECLGLEVGELWLVDPAAGVMRCEGAWAAAGLDIEALETAGRAATYPAGVGLAGRVWATGRPEWVGDVHADPEFRRKEAATAIGLRVACAFPVLQGATTIGAMLYFTRRVRPPDADVLALANDVGSRVGQYIAHKRAQQEVDRQREALARQETLAGLGRVAAGVVHELNNPLGIVSSRVELLLLQEAGGLPPEVVDDLRVVHRNVQRATAITQALLAFALPAPRARQPVDVNELVDDALARSAGMLAAGRVAVETAPAGGLPPVRADRDGLAQVLQAVLKNAVEAMPGGGRVRIATAPEGRGWVRLSVTDTGPGIPAEALARVFEPFHTTKPRAPGLGLAVVYGIVRDHGGRVEVASPPAGGATVVITLPADETAGEGR
jgi:PAS domain S-box-containing protein